MPTLTSEVDSLIRLLEGNIPASPQSPANVRRAERLERRLQAYFKALEQAFPYEAVEALYYKHVKEE